MARPSLQKDADVNMISNDALHVRWFGDCTETTDLEIKVFIHTQINNYGQL